MSKCWWWRANMYIVQPHACIETDTDKYTGQSMAERVCMLMVVLVCILVYCILMSYDESWPHTCSQTGIHARSGNVAMVGERKEQQQSIHAAGWTVFLSLALRPKTWTIRQTRWPNTAYGRTADAVDAPASAWLNELGIDITRGLICGASSQIYEEWTDAVRIISGP